MGLNKLLSELEGIAGEKEKFEPEKDFTDFVRKIDPKIDDESIRRLVDDVFHGRERIIRNYDIIKINRLTEGWLEEMRRRKIPQEVIESIKRKIAEMAYASLQRDIQSLTEEQFIFIGVGIRRLPNKIEERWNPERIRRDTIERIHAALEEIAAANGIPLLKSNSPDLSGYLKCEKFFFEEQKTLKILMPDLRIPKTRAYREQKAAPVFPIVAKNCHIGRGRGKYLIETREQWDKLVRWAIKWDQEADLDDHWMFQEFIRSPADRPVSYRILADCTGDVMASQLRYGPKFEENRRVKIQDRGEDEWAGMEKLLENPESEHFLNSRDIASNHKKKYKETGGHIIFDFKKGNFRPTKIEKKFLQTLGLDPLKPQLPEKIAAQARKIARALCFKPSRTIKSLYLGLDFIPTANGEGIFLDAHERPGLAPIKEVELLEHSEISETVRWVMEKIMGKLGKPPYRLGKLE